MCALAALAANAQDVVIDNVPYLLNAETKEATVSHPDGSFFAWMNYWPAEVTIPETITSDGVEYTVTKVGEQAFYMASTLKTVYLPNTVTTFEAQAFAGYIQKIYFGDNITTFENNAFGTLTDFTDFYIPTVTPPVLPQVGTTYTTPNASQRANITVHVPGESIEAYSQVWADFKQYVALSFPDTELNVGDETTLTFVLPATEGVEWTSSDDAVANVEDGKITAVAAGEATITAKLGDNEATCAVTVKSDSQSGIENVAIDTNAPARYFNLQGIEITNPAKGQVVIVRQGNKSVKTVF